MKFELVARVVATVSDDRKELVQKVTNDLGQQASAYINVAVRQQLIEALTKRFRGFPTAPQLAQSAVEVLLDELSHVHIQLPEVDVRITNMLPEPPKALPFVPPPLPITEPGADPEEGIWEEIDPLGQG